MRERVFWAIAAAVGLLAVPLERPSIEAYAGEPSSQASQDCVTIGTPKPSAIYVHQHTEPGGKVTEVVSSWESVTETGSRVRIDGPAGVIVQVNEHHVSDDALVIDKTTRLTAAGARMDETSFRPGLVAEPAFRACAGRSWPIPSVTAAFQSPRVNASAASPAGTLRIVAIREKVTVPSGTFDTVHYIRTSQSTDEYWKSAEHGVVVKHVATLPNGVVTEVLKSIR